MDGIYSMRNKDLVVDISWGCMSCFIQKISSGFLDLSFQLSDLKEISKILL